MTGSEGNRTDNCTGLQPSEPKLCTSGCGFFGSDSTMDLCSKCYRDLKLNKAQAASAQAAVDKLFDEPSAGSSFLTVGLPGADVAELVAPTPASGAGRCSSCRKKVGLLGFKCRCGSAFCGVHRYPEKHQCSVDFKALGRDAIAKANPVVKTDKIQRIK